MAVPEPEEPETIADLLRLAASKTPVGQGVSANVYSIPGFNDYLLRVPVAREGVFSLIPSLESQLTAHTALSPVYLCKTNYGQPVLANVRPRDGRGEEGLSQSNLHSTAFSIVRKVPGKSLDVLFADGARGYIKRQEMLKFLSGLDVEVLAGFMEQINALTERGITVDLFNFGNILYDETAADPKQRLRIIDVLPEPHTWEGEEHIARITDANNLTALKSRLYHNVKNLDVKNELDPKLEAAARLANFPKDKAEASSKNIKFARIERIQMCGTLSLDKTPAALRAKLAEIEEYHHAMRD
jgi:hypothetical protein